MKLRAVAFLILSGVTAALPASQSTMQGPKPPAGPGFQDCEMCPEMIVIPAGTFIIGSPPIEPGRQQDEGPQTQVRIGRPLAVGKYEVTRAQYGAFLSDTRHKVSGGCVTDRRSPGIWAPDERTNVHDPGFEQADDHPAACVSWNDAVAYVAWLNTKSGGGYRLLSEAEWEYVARAGSQMAYPWGPSIHDGCAFMNGFDTSILKKKGNLYESEVTPFAACSDGFVNTSPVGSFKPNAFGVYDMVGNLSEWVADCVTSSYSSLAIDGVSREGDCSKRLVRGGSWGTQPRQLRSAERIRYKPTDVDDSIGIRVAKSLIGGMYAGVAE